MQKVLFVLLVLLILFIIDLESADLLEKPVGSAVFVSFAGRNFFLGIDF